MGGHYAACRPDAPAEDVPGGSREALVNVPGVDAVKGTSTSCALPVGDKTDSAFGDSEEVVLKVVYWISMTILGGPEEPREGFVLGDRRGTV